VIPTAELVLDQLQHAHLAQPGGHYKELIANPLEKLGVK
jgi:hypothetical protein